MLMMINNVLLTELLWSVTTFKTHIVINFLLLFVLLKLWDHLSWVRAFLWSAVLSVGSFVIFFLLVGGILVWGLNIPYVLPQDADVGTYNILNSSLILAGIYSLLQMFIVGLINQWKPSNVWRIFACVLCANLLTALLVYKIMFTQ